MEEFHSNLGWTKNQINFLPSNFKLLKLVWTHFQSFFLIRLLPSINDSTCNKWKRYLQRFHLIIMFLWTHSKKLWFFSSMSKCWWIHYFTCKLKSIPNLGVTNNEKLYYSIYSSYCSSHEENKSSVSEKIIKNLFSIVYVSLTNRRGVKLF